MAGYHLTEITRGEYGELSKISEEILEAIDAQDQGNPVMVLIELSDIIGAVEGYLDKYYGKTIVLNDLIVMARATRRAFQTGVRK